MNTKTQFGHSGSDITLEYSRLISFFLHPIPYKGVLRDKEIEFLLASHVAIIYHR
jgi:hypothetical protein